MDGIVEVTGIVIKSIPVAEKDKRITLLTRERGKISSFAHGARKAGSPLMGAIRLFAYGKYRLYEGKDAYNMQSAQIEEYFDNITADMDKMCYGSYFLEFANYWTREYDRDPELLKLLYITLVAIQNPSLPHELVRRIYEIRTMVIEGEYYDIPPLKSSKVCRYTWNYICTSPLGKLYTFNITDEAMEELSHNVDYMIDKLMGTKLNSLDILKEMTQDN